MKRKYEDSVEYQMVTWLGANDCKAILRKELDSFGSYRQVSRALASLVQQKRLVRIGFGIYAKAAQSEYLDQPLVKDGFDEACLDALTRLGVKYTSSEVFEQYNNNGSQQIPVRMVVRLKDRFRGQLAYGKQKLVFERNVNAR